MRSLTSIIVHCSATPHGWRAGQPLSDIVEEIRRWHVEGNGWRDIGYHFIIGYDGEVEEGRPLDETGAHTYGHNYGSVGICLIGPGDTIDNPQKHFTTAQLNALEDLILALQSDYKSITSVTGHNDYTSAKTCPGFKVGPWWTDLIGRKKPTFIQRVFRKRT